MRSNILPPPFQIFRVVGFYVHYIQFPAFRDAVNDEVPPLLHRELGVGDGDTATKQLIVRGEAVRLTATEFKILQVMMVNPGRVYSAEEIYERVWESDAYAVENTVMVHISRIREKLELNPKKPEYLKVVWGIGYVFEAP